jgi:Fe-S cluster biogenesis protein NfuA
MSMSDDEVFKTVLKIINKLKPYIQNDGGDVDLVRIDDGIVYLKFTGACLHCAQIDVTLREGIESVLLENVPEIIGVELVPESDSILGGENE